MLSPPTLTLLKKFHWENMEKKTPGDKEQKQKSCIIPNPTENSKFYPCGEGKASKRGSGSFVTFIHI